MANISSNFHPLKETAERSTGLERFIVLIYVQLFWFSTEQQRTKDKRTRDAEVEVEVFL